MCGIYGVLTDHRAERFLPPEDLFSQRGPDHFGQSRKKGGRLALLHWRLSILDPTDRGSQPMSGEYNEIEGIFNGEIYNYRELRDQLKNSGYTFRTETDTEVLLNAYAEWGKQCVEKFNGQFAFGIWDGTRDRLFLARDRMGIKPLYYCDRDEAFAFSSEPKGLISSGLVQREVDSSAMVSYLIHRYVPHPKSIWKNIRQLPPGHTLTVDLNGTVQQNRYWTPPVGVREISEEDALERFDELFHDAVRLRLRSDVPLGIFLSGGIDSTAVTAAARSYRTSLDTFSIGFEGNERSELSDAKRVSDHFGTTHHTETVDWQNIESLKSVFEYYDEPLGDTSIIPTYLVCREASSSVKVVLSGDGGDEPFGGYNWYRDVNRYKKLGSVAPFLRPFLNLFSGRKKTYLSHADQPLELYRKAITPYFDFDEIRKLFSNVSPEQWYSSETDLYEQYMHPDLPPHKQFQFLDLHTFLVDDILRKVDRASMANSLEVRVPFLDHRLVEFAFTLPDDLLIKNGHGKTLVKKWLEPRVPDAVTEKSKSGFSCPVRQYWPESEMIDYIKNGRMVDQNLLSGKEFHSFSQSDSFHHHGKIWLLAALEQWFQHWME